jgi:GNAT superfamily N-acetyltransferase
MVKSSPLQSATHERNIWALFVDPEHERRGYGRMLHDTMTDWLRSRGVERLWLTTEPGTRAQKFYEAAGWHRSR